MSLELLIPGMKNQDKARGSLKVSLGKFEKALGDGLKKKVEEESFVFQNEGIEFVR